MLYMWREDAPCKPNIQVAQKQKRESTWSEHLMKCKYVHPYYFVLQILSSSNQHKRKNEKDSWTHNNNHHRPAASAGSFTAINASQSLSAVSSFGRPKIGTMAMVARKNLPFISLSVGWGIIAAQGTCGYCPFCRYGTVVGTKKSRRFLGTGHERIVGHLVPKEITLVTWRPHRIIFIMVRTAGELFRRLKGPVHHWLTAGFWHLLAGSWTVHGWFASWLWGGCNEDGTIVSR